MRGRELYFICLAKASIECGIGRQHLDWAEGRGASLREADSKTVRGSLSESAFDIPS